MKIFSILALAAISTGVFAAQDLNMMKNQANSQIDQKISNLQSAKLCVNGATTVDKFKACKFDMHEKMQKDKMQQMEEKKDEVLNTNQ